MGKTTAFGRLLFAAAIIAFGIQYYIYVTYHAGLGPPWTPAGKFWASLAGFVFVVTGVSIALNRQVRLAALVLAVTLLLRAVIGLAPGLVAQPRNPGPWTSTFEVLAMCGAALVLSGSVIATRSSYRGPNSAVTIGRIVFAIPLIVFGTQHFMYARFVATLVPAWIPERLFWACSVGVAFFAAALAILARKSAPLAAALLGTMFGLWVLIVHAPRVAAASHNANEWTSMFVALAMSGAGFLIAGILAGQDRIPRSY